ncbi:MAG: diaminopimelate decarboxylase [miscellaneous Crenarchaeota group-6 archaeon AD8-1]|nr:MAG: diaminopimelate decarboxylase [miscellaneous Crenarchaeota group-6 archaeon AD8-1]
MKNKDGHLLFDNINVEDLVKEFDTPLYLISEKRIRDKYRTLHDILIQDYDKIRIYYAAKANSNLNVLKILRTEGAYLDAVSPGEIFLALKAGFLPERILFTGTSVRTDELNFIADSQVTVNIDSYSELNRLLNHMIPKTLSVRINPKIGSGHHDHCITAGPETKFGLWEEVTLKTYQKAKEVGVEKFGIHMHIGSGILKIESILLAFNNLLSMAKKIRDKINITFEFIDMGGGLGVPYKPQEKEIDLTLFSKKILSLFKRKITEYNLGNPFFCLEPGRYLVSDSSILLTSVNTIKVTPFKKFVGVDVGFNTLLRPSMYGSYHHILVANKLNSPKNQIYDVVGPICESGDVIAKNRQLPMVEEGDLLAILNAGAYGFAMSSQYNSRPRAAEVLIKDKKYFLSRKRETFNSLLLNQQIEK